MSRTRRALAHDRPRVRRPTWPAVRHGDGANGRYRNTAQTAQFLDKNRPTYVGGILEMLNARLFGFWNDLGTALKTGQPQNE